MGEAFHSLVLEPLEFARSYLVMAHTGNAQRIESEHEAMRRHWLNAWQSVTLLNMTILQNLRLRIFPQVPAPPVLLNDQFQIRGELLETRGAGVFQKHPAAILDIFLLWQQHPEVKGLAAGTMRALWHARDLIDAGLRRRKKHRTQFMEILRMPSGLTHTLRRMNQFGVLGRYLPEFGRIVGQMQHDLFHGAL